MTAEPGDNMTGHGGFRASDADRERAVDALKTAFVQGQLTRDELDMRTGQALGSRTYGELDAVWTGIPAGPVRARREPGLARGRKPVRRSAVAWGACLIITPALVAAFFTYVGGFLILLVLAFAGTVLTGDGAQRRW